jgi:hypothetical protein
MSKRTTKTVETKIGTTSFTNKNSIEFSPAPSNSENKKSVISYLSTTSSGPSSLLSKKIDPVIPVELKQVNVVPEVKLSPLRTRLKERNSKNVKLDEAPHPLCEKNNTTKPKKKVMVDVKSPPKVFKSPTWYKSPRQKDQKKEDSQSVVFKQLLLKDSRYTEQEIDKILNDHK